MPGGTIRSRRTCRATTTRRALMITRPPWPARPPGRPDLVIVGSRRARAPPPPRPASPGAAARAARRDDPGAGRKPGPVVGEHRLPAGRRTAGRRRRRDGRDPFVGSSTECRPRWPPRLCAGAGAGNPLWSIHALAVGYVAGRAHQGHRLQGRPVVPRRLPAAGRRERLGASRTRFRAVTAPRSATPGN